MIVTIDHVGMNILYVVRNGSPRRDFRDKNHDSHDRKYRDSRDKSLSADGNTGRHELHESQRVREDRGDSHGKSNGRSRFRE